MPVAIKGTGGGSVTLTAGAAAADTTLTLPNTTGTVINTAPSTSGNVLTSNGTAWVSSAPAGSTVPSATAIGQVPFSTDGSTWTSTQKIVQGTAVASTSGTSIDFTSIPSWVKRITVMFNGVSLNGSSYILIQGITAGGVISTGYSSNGNLLPSSTPSGTSHYSTAGFSTFFDGASVVASGSLILSLLGSNVWVIQGVLARSDTAGYLITSTGVGSLGAQLTGVRITTANGTDTFDAGSINIMYE